MPKIERKEEILQMNKPENPLTRGYVSALELSTYFTSYSNQAYDNMARRLKITAYKFRDEPNKTFYSLEEVLDHVEPNRLRELGFAFQDEITKSKRENGFVDWNDITAKLEVMKSQKPVEPATRKPRKANKKVKETTAPMSDPKPWFRDQEAKEEFNRRQAEDRKKKLDAAVESFAEALDPETPPKTMSQEEFWTELRRIIKENPGELAPQQPVRAPKPFHYKKTTMVMEPMSFTINVTLETEDPDVLLELREIYQQILGLMDRVNGRNGRDALDDLEGVDPNKPLN